MDGPVEVEFVGGYHDGTRHVLTEFKERIRLPIPPQVSSARGYDPGDLVDIPLATYKWNGSITDTGVRIFVPVK